MGDVRTPVHPSLDRAKADLSNALPRSVLAAALSLENAACVVLCETSNATNRIMIASDDQTHRVRRPHRDAISEACPRLPDVHRWKADLSASGLCFTKQHVCSSNGQYPDIELRSTRSASSYWAAFCIPRRSFAAESIFSNRGSSRIGPRSGSTSKCRRCIGLCSFSKKG